MNDPNILIGNKENLEEFKKHFGPHDKKTLDFYYRMATKKQTIIIVRRLASNAPQMQIAVVPYKLLNSEKTVREVIKGKSFALMGWIQKLNVDPKRLFVFGELLPKNETDVFSKPVPIRLKKRKPFEPFGGDNAVLV